DIFLDHISAFLELPPPPPITIADIVRSQPGSSHIVCHNLASHNIRVEFSSPDRLPIPCTLVPPPKVTVAPEAIVCDAKLLGAVTTTGETLRPDVETGIRSVLQALSKPLALTTDS